MKAVGKPSNKVGIRFTLLPPFPFQCGRAILPGTRQFPQRRPHRPQELRVSSTQMAGRGRQKQGRPSPPGASSPRGSCEGNERCTLTRNRHPRGAFAEATDDDTISRAGPAHHSPARTAPARPLRGRGRRAGGAGSAHARSRLAAGSIQTAAAREQRARPPWTGSPPASPCTAGRTAAGRPQVRTGDLALPCRGAAGEAVSVSEIQCRPGLCCPSRSPTTGFIQVSCPHLRLRWTHFSARAPLWAGRVLLGATGGSAVPNSGLGAQTLPFGRPRNHRPHLRRVGGPARR